MEQTQTTRATGGCSTFRALIVIFQPKIPKVYLKVYRRPHPVLHFLKKRLLTYAIGLFALVNFEFFGLLYSARPPSILAGNTRLPLGAISNNAGAWTCVGQPVYVEYACFMKNVFATLPPYFGASFSYFPASAGGVALNVLPYSILLIGSSLLVGLAITLGVARLGGPNINSRRNSALKIIAVIAASIPAFWIASALLWELFGLLNWPSFSMGPAPVPTEFQLLMLRYIAPAAVLALVAFSQTYIFFSRGFEHVADSNFLRASKARGLGIGAVFRNYVLGNSMLNVLSNSGIIIGGIISADILVEGIFGFRGIGTIIIDGLLARDSPLLVASLFYIVVLAIGMSFCFDLVRWRLDPRLRETSGQPYENVRFKSSPVAFPVPREWSTVSYPQRLRSKFTRRKARVQFEKLVTQVLQEQESFPSNGGSDDSPSD